MVATEHQTGKDTSSQSIKPSLPISRFHRGNFHFNGFNDFGRRQGCWDQKKLKDLKSFNSRWSSRNSTRTPLYLSRNFHTFKGEQNRFRLFLCIEHTRDHPLRFNPLGLIALPCDQQCLHLATANVSARVPKKHRKLTEPKNARLRRLAPNTAPPAQGCNELGYVGLLMDHVKPFSLQFIWLQHTNSTEGHFHTPEKRRKKKGKQTKQKSCENWNFTQMYHKNCETFAQVSIKTHHTLARSSTKESFKVHLPNKNLPPGN